MSTTLVGIVILNKKKAKEGRIDLQPSFKFTVSTGCPRMIYNTLFEKNTKSIKSTPIYNDNSCIVLVTISTLCFDNIIIIC